LFILTLCITNSFSNKVGYHQSAQFGESCWSADNQRLTIS